MQSCFCCQPIRNTSYICPACWEAYSAQALQEMRREVDTIEKSTPLSLSGQLHWQHTALHYEQSWHISSVQHHPLEN